MGPMGPSQVLEYASQGLANLQLEKEHQQQFHMKISMQLVLISVTNHSRVSYYIKSNDLTYQTDPFQIP